MPNKQTCSKRPRLRNLQPNSKRGRLLHIGNVSETNIRQFLMGLAHLRCYINIRVIH